MPRSLAEGRMKVSFLDSLPTNPEAAKVAEMNAGIDLSCVIAATDFALGPVDSDRIDDKALCDEGNVKAMGPSNYVANMTFFRELTPTGASETAATADVAWKTFTGKGVRGYFAKRIGPKSRQPWAAGDIYDIYEVIADNPQDPSSWAGYLKFRQPFEVGGLVVLRKSVVA